MVLSQAGDCVYVYGGFSKVRLLALGSRPMCDHTVA
jgi:hypothetical protein